MTTPSKLKLTTEFRAYLSHQRPWAGVSPVNPHFQDFCEGTLTNWKKIKNMGIPINDTIVYASQSVDEQVVLAQDKDDLEYVSRRIEEEYGKVGSRRKGEM